MKGETVADLLRKNSVEVPEEWLDWTVKHIFFPKMELIFMKIVIDRYLDYKTVDQLRGLYMNKETFYEYRNNPLLAQLEGVRPLLDDITFILL